MNDETKEYFENLALQAKELQTRRGQTSKNQYLKRINFSHLERREFIFNKVVNQHK